MMQFYYTAAALLMHCFYTADAPLLHCCFTAITRPLHCHYTATTQLLAELLFYTLPTLNTILQSWPLHHMLHRTTLTLPPRHCRSQSFINMLLAGPLHYLYSRRLLQSMHQRGKLLRHGVPHSISRVADVAVGLRHKCIVLSSLQGQEHSAKEVQALILQQVSIGSRHRPTTLTRAGRRHAGVSWGTIASAIYNTHA